MNNDMGNKDEYDRFLLVWDMNGLEAAINMSEMARNDVEAKLKGTHPTDSISTMLNYYELRTRFNNQRNYEIYAINLPSDTTRDDVFRWFDGNEQSMADLIRHKGTPFRKRENIKPVIL